jgi:hypothetical protein
MATRFSGGRSQSTRKEQPTMGKPKPGEVGDFFTLISMKSPNFSQKAKF